MNKFNFNTGVNAFNTTNFPYDYHKKVGNIVQSNGTLVIPFECDAPKNAILMYCCDNPELDASKSDNVIVREMFNTSMISKYAYFRI